jgi:hypothetical protein
MRDFKTYIGNLQFLTADQEVEAGEHARTRFQYDRPISEK